jgi:hypothetical protein
MRGTMIIVTLIRTSPTDIILRLEDAMKGEGDQAFLSWFEESVLASELQTIRDRQVLWVHQPHGDPLSYTRSLGFGVAGSSLNLIEDVVPCRWRIIHQWAGASCATMAPRLHPRHGDRAPGVPCACDVGVGQGRPPYLGPLAGRQAPFGLRPDQGCLNKATS